MRHLFVPACVCLMTWSGSTGSDLKPSLEAFSGVSVVNKRPGASTPRTGVNSIAQENAAARDETTAELTAPSNAPIDIPEQAGVEQTLEPQQVPLPPVAKPVVHRSRQEVCDTLTKAAQLNDLPVPFFIRLLFQESGFKPGLVSSAGAQGVAQFMPETAASMGLDNPFDPLQAIPASARLLRDLFQQFGNLGLAAAAYNAGPKRIQVWLAKKGKLPQETQGYVKIITGRPAETWKVAVAGNLDMSLPRHAPCQEAAGVNAWNGANRVPLPLRSPRMRTVSAEKRAPIQTATSTVSVKQQMGHLTPIAKIEKPAKAAAAQATNGAIQLAARKNSADKIKLGRKRGKMDQKTAGKPLEVAMAAHGSAK
jgi:Transglycosylase SLT domain